MSRKVPVLVDSIDGLERLSIPEPVWVGGCNSSSELGTGIYLHGVHIGKHRVVLHTYSTWARQNKSICVGDEYRLADEQDIRTIEAICGRDVAAKVADVLGVKTVDA
jgi:hypothetical protein